MEELFEREAAWESDRIDRALAEEEAAYRERLAKEAKC